jgi:hypothetical protein
MPAIPCPQCGRLLELSDELRGALVQCPLCRTAFDAPQEQPAPQRSIPAAILPRIPAAQRPRAALQFSDPEPGRLPVRCQAALASAAFWLQMTVILQGLSGFCCCSVSGPGAVGRDFPYPSAIVWMLLCKYVPLVFAGLASARLPGRSKYGLSFAGGILVLLSSVWSLLEVGALALLGLPNVPRGNQVFGSDFWLLACLVALAGTVCGFVAGVKTLTVLTDPDVRRAFR